jgi:hypothetical protein
MPQLKCTWNSAETRFVIELSNRANVECVRRPYSHKWLMQWHDGKHFMIDKFECQVRRNQVVLAHRQQLLAPWWDVGDERLSMRWTRCGTGLVYYRTCENRIVLAAANPCGLPEFRLAFPSSLIPFAPVFCGMGIIDYV